MFAKTWKALLVMLFGVMLIAPQNSVSAAPVAAGAATPEAAVSTLIKALQDPAATGVACNALTGQLDDCPITARLRTRLQNPTPEENGNLVSRSQNPPSSVAVTLVDSDGQTARVNTKWEYGASSYTITFVVVKGADGWLVDDSYCAGNPQTSIYNSPVGPCSMDASSPGTSAGGESATNVPGMPNTGAGDQITLLISLTLLALGLAALGIELAWRRA